MYKYIVRLSLAQLARVQGGGNGGSSGDLHELADGEVPNSSSLHETTEADRAKDLAHTKAGLEHTNQDVPSALGLERAATEEEDAQLGPSQDVPTSVSGPDALSYHDGVGVPRESEPTGRARLSGETEGTLWSACICVKNICRLCSADI